MPFRLRYLAHDLELAGGEFVVGRSTDCQLSLDDPLVSRRHAVLRVRRDGVSVQDLGSRNGVLVNGAKIDGERELAPGDKISIGSQEMVLQNADESGQLNTAGHEEIYRRATQTLGAAHVLDLRAVVESATVAPHQMADGVTSDTSRSLQSFQLLGGVADKALAMGRAEEAERILQALLVDILTRARDGASIEPPIAEAAAKYAARLGGATTKGIWVDYVFELYKRMKTPLPAQIVDELYTVVRKVKNVDLPMLRSYLSDLRVTAASLGPAQRFLIQRLEGLERLVSLR
jgi:predicted component of type VI protein secretion system